MKGEFPGGWLIHHRPLFGALAGIVISLLLSFESSAAPVMVIAQPIWNFGLVTNLSSLSHDFWVRNSGDAPLLISRVASTCEACLQATIQNTNVPPGQTTVIHALLDFRVLHGAVSRAIIVNCNDPRNPASVLELNGVVAEVYRIDPAAPLLDLADGPNAISIEITPLFQLHAPLSRFSCEDTNLQFALSPQTNGVSLLAVQAANTLPYSNQTVKVVVSSISSDDPPCSLDLFIRNAPRLELLPTQLTFETQLDSETRILWLKQHGPTPMALLDAVLSPDKFQCEIDPDPDGRDYTIYVTALPQQYSTSQTNTMVLKMMDSSRHEHDINVPVLMQRP